MQATTDPPITEKPPANATCGSDKTAAALATSESTDGKDAPRQISAMQAYVRIFSYGTPTVLSLQAIAIIAACGSGVALAFVNLVLGNFITLLSEFSSGRDVPDNFMSLVSKQSLYFVYIGIARFGCIYLYSAIMTYTALRLGRDVRHDYLRSALRQDISFFDHGSAGSISMQATSNGRLIQSGTAEKLGQMIQAATTFIAAFVIAFVSQWKLTLILICIVPALILMVGTAGGMDAGLETQILKIYAQAGAFAESSLGNVRAIHAFSLRSRIVNRYATYLDEAQTLGQKKNVLYGLLFAGEYFVMFAGIGLAFWQGIAMIARGEVHGIGTVFTVLFSVVIAAAMLNSVAPNMVTFTRAATAATELFSLIDRVSQIDPLDPAGEKPASFEGSIEISGLDFSYPTRRDVTVLEDFSLRVPAGKVTALVGASGSGKSTIIGLLERWYNPSRGDITLDGTPIKNLNLQWLRTNIRLVQQEPVLFNGTVFENIRNGLIGTPWEHESPEQQLLRVKDAARTAFAHDFIENLPQQYHTRIGERGGLLSGGQKQRVAIARSIISQPKVLLLDEATSALDPHAEAIVQKALDKASKNRTTIVIAHKLKTIQAADNIVVMAKGRIIEQGQHAELIARGAAYSNLVRAQDLSLREENSGSEPSHEDQNESIFEKSVSLGRQDTNTREELKLLSKREDYGLSPSNGILSNAVRLIRSTSDLKWWYVFSLISSVLGAGVYPGQALLLGKVMDIFTPELNQSRGNFFALMFFIMAICLLFVYMAMGWTSNHIAQAYGHEILVLSTVTIVACSILSIAVSWKLGLVGVFAGIPPMVLGGYIRIRVETRMDAKIDAKFSNSASIASESVSAIRTVSSLAIENDVLLRYTNELDTAISESRATLASMMTVFAFTQSVEFFVLALGFWWGSKLIQQGDIDFYQFIVSFMAVYFSGQGCATIFTFASSFTKANSAANYFFWLHSLEGTVRETDQNRDSVSSGGCTSYKLEDVKFAYPLAPDNSVLKGVSLSIRPGQFVAFVGASGCGKSTMISLLERFYDPISGRIVIDEINDLTDLNPRLYRRAVSLVQQEPTLFPGTIRENVLMGVDQDGSEEVTVDSATIESACRAANAWDFVSSLPEGLNTPCGTGGAQLSGGQRQRIAIARALIRNPRVILLDEATSALDTESEKVVQAALMNAASSGHRITVAVAHRLSTVTNADRIFVFYSGRIVEAGTHSELYALGGLYSKMCEAQNL
ncbi:ATP-binding cassette multidrug transport protein [Hortaea werneckii]|nr:ATP-binding cassette multidrug transport protein [Hortaea werneckii]